MDWEARSGLKPHVVPWLPMKLKRLNGLGSPFGIETKKTIDSRIEILRLNGLGSPFGIETRGIALGIAEFFERLNGLGSPFGIETCIHSILEMDCDGG